MPEPHDVRPASKRRRHKPPSQTLAPPSSSTSGRLLCSTITPHRNSAASYQPREEIPFPPRVNRSPNPTELQNSSSQEIAYYPSNASFKAPVQLDRRNVQENPSSNATTSIQVGCTPAPYNGRSHLIPSFPRLNLPTLANVSSSLPFPPAPSFTPSRDGLSPHMNPGDPLLQVNQETSPQRRLQPCDGSHPVTVQNSGNQSPITPSELPRIFDGLRARSEGESTNFGNGLQQSNHMRRAIGNELPFSTTADTVVPILRSIGPVADALAMIPDNSPIISALANVLTLHSNNGVLVRSQREQILNFRGFQSNSNPNFHALLVLCKIDLDILAWIFVVSKHGRKDDVARRILASLRSPLRYRRPSSSRRPISLGSCSRATVSTAPSTYQVVHQGAENDGMDDISRSRSSMPSSPPPTPNIPGLRGDRLLKHLGRQLNCETDTREPSALQNVFQNGSRAVRCVRDIRDRQPGGQAHDLLHGYLFKDGENPFNKPINPPLGISQNYIVFTSVQLSRGNSDPVLIFPSPTPIDPNVHREIRGGILEIQLRCLRIDPKKPRTEWKQSWPFPATCRVNGHVVTLNQAQRYTNGKLAGIDTATNITPYIRKFKSGIREINRVSLRRQTSTATPASGQFVLFVQEVLVFARETMAKNVHIGSERYWADHRRTLEEKGIISHSTSTFEMARMGVVQFLTDPDGLTVSSMKVSLRCPLALTRISTPVKGKRCHHVQCFDLENFLEYSRRSSKFECPVCNKNTAYPSMLVVSPYIESALNKYKDCDEVEIFQDGSMVPVEREQSGVPSDDEVDEGPRSRVCEAAGKGYSGSKVADVVDLTLDSDVDEPVSALNRNCPTSSKVTIASTAHGSPLSSMPASGPDNPGGKERPQDDVTMAGLADKESSNKVTGLDQEVEFSFRSDFVPWTDARQLHQAATVSGRIQTTAGSAGENWPIDVIAIDSD